MHDRQTAVRWPFLNKFTQSAGISTVQTHRNDIDGLRAIAVVPVLLFHAAVRGFSGGYVGVDVFFVISGFLITGIISREVERGVFTVPKFYERRIRRIFPALFVLLMGVFAVGLAVLVPPDMAQLGKSIVATAVFSSNIFFYRQSGYFDTAAVTKPLLHTWSLAVEEQYYIVFPLFLWVMYRWRREWVVPAIVVMMLLSFAASWSLVLKSQTAAFFLPQSRAWELLLGSALSYAPRYSNWLVSTVGLMFIAAAVFLFSTATPFPGPSALLPCLGAAAILWAADGTAVGEALSNPVLTFIGKVSYSLYLWHWPILVFARFLYGDVLPAAVSIFCLSVAFVIATLSWRYVERPFRKRGPSPRVPLMAGGAAIAASAALGMAATTGFPQRLPPEAVAVASIANEKRPNVQGCFYPEGPNPKSIAAACFGGQAPQVVVWGDSHALQYVAPLEQQLGVAVRIIGRGGCVPTDLTPVRTDRRADEDCAKFNAEVLHRIVDESRIRTVILSGRWARFTFPLKDDEAQRFEDLPTDQGRDELISSLSRVIDRLRSRGKQVVLIGVEPEFHERLPICLSRALWLRRSLEICSFREATLPGTDLDRSLQHLADESPGILLFRPSDVICRSGRCARIFQGLPVTRDTDHFSNIAAQHVAGSLAAILTSSEHNGHRIQAIHG